MILTAIRLPNDARAPRCFCGARTPCALSSQRRMSAMSICGARAPRVLSCQRRMSAMRLLWGAHAVRAVFPTTNESKEARAAREPHNDSVRDEHLWSARSVRAVFPTTNERKEASVGRARRARCLPNDERAQGVFPTSNERKEARAAREPHNDSVRDEHLWSARPARAVFPTTNERLLMLHRCLCLGRIRRCLCVGSKARRPAPAGRSAVSLRAASAVSPRPASARGRWWGSMMRTTKQG